MERRFIRVDCDYGAEGLWDERGAMYYVASFPLSEELQQRILAWQKKFDEECEPWDNGFDREAHAVEGVAIARLIKQQLPECDVVVLDQRVNDDGSLCEEVPPPGRHLLED